jgi:hypothetical protein
MAGPFDKFPRPVRQQGPGLPPPIALDRFNNMIRRGHIVLYHNDVDLALEVVSVEPAMDPTLPMPMMRIIVRGEFPILVPTAQPSKSFAVCGMTQKMQEEMQRGQMNGQPADPPAAEELPAEPAIKLTDPE